MTPHLEKEMTKSQQPRTIAPVGPRRERRTSRVLAALLLTATALTLAAAAGAQTHEFLLRAPASEIDGIAATHGLTVLDQIDPSSDALNRLVYLVEAPAAIDPGQVIADVLAMEPQAAGMELAVLASVAESFPHPSLNQTPDSLLPALAAATDVPFGDDGDGDSDSDDRLVWGGYVDQPAAAVLKVTQAQSSYKGDATVAIIDTGIDPNHPLFADRIVPGYDFVNDVAGSASEWVDVDQSLMIILDQSLMIILDEHDIVSLGQSLMIILDDQQEADLDLAALPPAFGHGTMVAGVIHRVAPEASLMPLKAFDGWGNANIYDIVRAIYYAVDHGANVINMSFSMKTFSPELMRAVNYAARHGVACVASAGNDGEEQLVFPAALGNAIGVASTAVDDTISPFSNYGSDLVTVAAPGENIVTAYPGGGWALASGTSFSAPWISAAVALFADKNGTKHAPGQADYYLSSDALSFAMPVHGLGEHRPGWGRADLEWALDELETQ